MGCNNRAQWFRDFLEFAERLRGDRFRVANQSTWERGRK